MLPLMGREKCDMFAHFLRPLSETYIRGHREGRGLVFCCALALLIFHHSPYADPAEAVIACTYAMLAAESLGLGNAIIGGAPPIPRRTKALCAKLGVPAGHTPSLSLILGHPAAHFRRASRRHFVGVGIVKRGASNVVG